MFDMPMIVYGGAGAAVVGATGFFWMLVGGWRRRGKGAGGASAQDAREAQLGAGVFERMIRPSVRWVAARARRLTPTGRVRSLERKVRLAGPEASWTLDRVLAAKLGLALVAGLAGFWIGGQLGAAKMFIYAGIGVVGGFLLPDLILWGRARERQMIIRRSLPDVLDQMTICVESGLGFDAALQRVGEGGSGPLAEELQRTLKEIAVGVPRREALNNLVERTDVAALRRFVVAIRQADEYGLPIARVLRVQAAQLRVQRRRAAEERAMKMPVKIVFPLVFCIFPALFVVLLGPAVVRIINTFL